MSHPTADALNATATSAAVAPSVDHMDPLTDAEPALDDGPRFFAYGGLDEFEVRDVLRQFEPVVCDVRGSIPEERRIWAWRIAAALNACVGTRHDELPRTGELARLRADLAAYQRFAAGVRGAVGDAREIRDLIRQLAEDVG